MRTKLSVAVAGTAVTLAACAEPTSAPQATVTDVGEASFAAGGNGQGRIPNEYIVVFNDDVDDAVIRGRAKAAAVGGRVTFAYGAVLKGFAGELPVRYCVAFPCVSRSMR